MFHIGIDLVSVHKIRKVFSTDSSRLAKVFTLREIDYCQKRKDRFQHFAVRFAAKEAMFKAIGTGWVGEIKWTDVEILNEDSGKPKLNFYGKVKELVEKMGVQEVLVSLSHSKEYALAQVLLVSRACAN